MAPGQELNYDIINGRRFDYVHHETSACWAGTKTERL